MPAKSSLGPEELIIPVCEIPANGIRSTVDGGWRLSFDLPADKETGLIVAAISLMRNRSLTITIGPSDAKE